MKGCLKIFGIVVLICVLLFTVLFFIYRYNLLNKLEKRETVIKEEWNYIYNNSQARYKQLQELNTLTVNEHIVGDSLEFYLNKYKNDKNKECNMDYSMREYELNKEYVKILDYYNDKRDSINVNVKSLLNKLLENDKQANRTIEEYNDNVLIFNKSLIKFPGSRIAKKNGFKSQKYFKIIYGTENKNLMIIEKENQEWIKNGYGTEEEKRLSE